MIIGLNGKKRAGKDTVADYLGEKYGFTKIGFADTMYEAVCSLWGITYEQALKYKETGSVAIHVNWDGTIPSDVLSHNWTWRAHLQRFGTDMGRRVFGNDFWVERMIERYFDPLTDAEFRKLRFVVSDVRFDNEAKALVKLGGDIWHIERPGIDDGDSHESEAGIDDAWIEGDICNDGTMEELHVVLDEWMRKAYTLDPV